MHGVNPSNQFLNNYGLALDPTSNILYVSDCYKSRIMSFTPGATNGTLVFGGNGFGTNNTQLSVVIGLYFRFIIEQFTHC